jgi:hypothetical protein
MYAGSLDRREVEAEGFAPSGGWVEAVARTSLPPTRTRTRGWAAHPLAAVLHPLQPIQSHATGPVLLSGRAGPFRRIGKFLSLIILRHPGTQGKNGDTSSVSPLLTSVEKS